jgi:hypothetical protein
MSQTAVGKRNERDGQAVGCASPDDESLPLTEHKTGTLVQPLDSPAHSHPSGDMVITAEMCFFCFDVLHCHLNQSASLRQPTFSNDSL